MTLDFTGSTRTLHPSPNYQGIPIEPAFEDYTFMMFDLCDALEIKCEIYPMMGNIENALALIDKDGNPLIVYDRRLSSLIGYDGANAVIAHELGHHYCSHLTDPAEKTNHEIEKEADRFMGFAMKKLGVGLASLLDIYVKLGLDVASPTHPSFDKRKIAISEGFNATSLDAICQRPSSEATP